MNNLCPYDLSEHMEVDGVPSLEFALLALGSIHTVLPAVHIYILHTVYLKNANLLNSYAMPFSTVS